MNFCYHNPVRIVFGADLLQACRELESDKILLVTSRGFSARGLTAKVREVLGKRVVGVVDSITPNPELSELVALKATLQNLDFDSLLAIGGGSVLDSAKFLSTRGDVVARDGGLHIEGVGRGASGSESLARAIFAIPTTAGTGSELTKWATIWDSKAGVKYSLQSESLYPHTAIYDVNLTRTLSRETTIATGLDALSHACESIWNKNANPISTHYALDSIALIVRTLPALTEDLGELGLREDMMRASMQAALAFSNTQTALAHAISYPITMRFGVPHGLACSFSIPLLLECLPKCEAREILSPLSGAIKELFVALKVSTNPRDYGLDSVMIEEIFGSLNARAKNGVFALEEVKQKFSLADNKTNLH